MSKGISSSGRALDSHSRGTGIDTRILKLVFLYNYFRCQLQHNFFVPNRKCWRIEKMYKEEQLKWQSARFAFERHRDRYPDSPISFSLQLFSLPIATQVFCAKQKRLENRTNMQGGLAQVVERSIRIRQAPGWRPGYSNWLFFTIIFIANFNASFLCQTEKVGEQKICPRGISSSGRALDSHSRGTGMETRILQLVILYNNFHCQFQRKFFVPNRKGWRIENMSKGDQLKWQSARFAFERHRDRDTDTPIGYCLQLFTLPISTQVCCAKQKRLENRKNVQGGLAQVVERSIRIREAPGSIPGFSKQFFFTIIFVANCNTSFLCQTEKVGEQKTCPRGLAPVVERSIRIREAPGSIPGFSNQFFFTIIFVANCNTSFLCQTEKVGEQNKYARGISSSGRALDSHSIGTGMETRILQLVILYNNFHCQFQRKFFVPNRKGWRIENMSKGDQLKWQSARFAFERHRDRDTDTPIGYCLQLFTLPISTQVCCAKQKRLENRKNVQGGLAQVVERSIRIREAPGSIPGFSNQFFFTIIFVANCNTSFLCQTEKVGEQNKYARGLAQVVERSIRIRQAPGWRPGYSNWLFFTIIFIANFNASFLCQTEKVGEQKICPRGISSSGRALDSHSRGTAIETRILQLVIVYNYLHCQFQRKFVVPNRKGWRIEKMSKGDQLKWQSARFAFERHRDRYPDSPISFSLQLFSLPIATQVFCAKQKRLENRQTCPRGLAQVVERSIRIREAPGSIPGFSNQFFFTIIFVATKFVVPNRKGWRIETMSKGISSRALDSKRHRDRYPDSLISFSLQLFSLPIATQVFCAKQKRWENYARGISSSGRALDSHSIGTGMETRILQLVILYNNFHCQFQRKFFVPNRKGWRIENMSKGDQLKWQSARFAFERHRDRDTDTPIGYSLQLFSLPISTQVCCAKQKRLENRKNVQGGLAQVVERSIRIREAPGSIPGFSNQFFFTIIFVANCNTSFLCQTEKVGEQKNMLAQVVERSIRIRQAPGWRPGYSNWLFFTIIFIANFNASFLCQTEKVGEQKICPRGISSSGRALDSHSRGTGIDTRILQLVFLYNYFRCQLQHKFFVPNRKGWRIEKMCKGISSSGRALDSHSIGTGMETRILQLVILYNNFHCQFQRKFFVPNRKGWRIENMSKGDQLKWQSARFAFERHRDRDTDTPIGYCLQLFTLPISTQVCCAKQKRLENRKNVQGGLAQVVERSIRIREAPGSIPGFSNQFFFTIIFVANCNTSFLCQTEKVGEQKICPRGLAPVVERQIRIREAPGSIPGFSHQFFFTIIFVAKCNTSFL